MSDGALPPVLSSEGARIVIEIRNEQPIDLLDFTGSLTGLAREHEANLREARPELPLEETRLLVVEVRKGSIIFELVPALAPFVSSAELVNTSVDFVRNLSGAVDWLRKPNGRMPDPTTQRLKNLGDSMKAIAADPSGELNISARHAEGEVLQEFRIQKQDAQTVIENARAQRKEIERPASDLYRKVLMTLHQSSVDDVRIGKRTSEKGIVERIDSVPRSLIYVSDVAGQRIKAEILRPDGNPYKKDGACVDVDVETVDGRPRAYRVLAVHDIIDLDDE